MPKRFTDTEKWKKPAFRKKSLKCKCFWFYLLDNCNHAGMWEVDFELASFCIGETLDSKYIAESLKDKIVVLDNGKKWFIPDFIDFQYGNLSKECKPHKPVIELLNKYNLMKGFAKGIKRVKEQVKEKDKEQDKSKVISNPPFVNLSIEEKKILVDKFGKDTIMLYIDKINDWILANGKKPYKDYAATLRNWLRKDNIKEKVKVFQAPVVKKPEEKVFQGSKIKDLTKNIG